MDTVRHVDSFMWVETDTKCHIYYELMSLELPENHTVKIYITCFFGEYTITTYDANGLEIDHKYMTFRDHEFDFTQKPHFIRASGPITEYGQNYSTYYNSYNGCDISWKPHYNITQNENILVYGSDRDIFCLFKNENQLIAGEFSSFQDLYNIMFNDIMNEKTPVRIFGGKYNGAFAPNELKQLGSYKS